MKVLIIEDDPEIVEIISLTFEIRWPAVQIVSTHLGKKGVEMVESESPDIIVLDLGLPDISGFNALKEIRTFSDVPVLILTVRGEEADVVKGLEWGADDYMTKPFRQLELTSRIQALIRRSGPALKEEPVTCGRLIFVPANRQLLNNGVEVKITRTEAAIMESLMKKCGDTVTYSELSEALWGSDSPDSVDSLRVYIRRLRQKVEENPEEPKIILNHPGVGYSIAREV